MSRYAFSSVINVCNMANKFYQPGDQEIGLPSRATGSMTVHF